VSDLFSDEAKESMKILDVGCGDGGNIRMFNGLSPIAEKMYFYGVDASPRLIELANEYNKKNEIKNCFFEVGNAEDLPYEDGEFDIVVCTEVLEHLLHPEIALSEIYRVLKNGGAATITTPNRENILRKIAGTRLKEYIEKDYKKIETRPIPDDEKLYGHISVMSSKELVQMVKNLGFKIEKIKRASLVYGQPFFDRHQVMFGIILIIDSILDHIPRTYNFSWGIVLKLIK